MGKRSRIFGWRADMNRILVLWDRLPRPAQFAAELLAAALLSYGLGWTADRLNRSKNRRDQAEERMAQDLHLAAQQSERIADILEREHPPLPRPSLLDDLPISKSDAVKDLGMREYLSLVSSELDCRDPKGVKEACSALP